MLLETYLRELREIRSTGAGVEEESYYHPLATLLNEIGRQLKPKVRCILQLANRGAGKPDGGLFTADQFGKGAGSAPLPGQLPARGAIEVKPAKNDAWVTVEAKQVTRYWNRYRQALVTNYRDFVLVGQDTDGNPAILETYRLADSEQQFWEAAATPRKTDQEHGPRFIEFLQRVMLHAAPLSAPEDVAWFLASYARAAKTRIERLELAADAVLAPFCPSQADLWGTSGTLGNILEYRKVHKGLKALAVFNLVFPNTKIAREIDAVTEQCHRDYKITFLKSYLTARIAYKYSFGEGLGVTEQHGDDRDPKAIEEMTGVFTELRELLHA